MRKPLTRTQPRPPAADRDPDLDLIERAKGGDREAVSQLIDRLAPVIQIRVAHILRLRARRQRSTRQEVADFVQEVFTSLFASDWRALSAWDPERHASLDTFVGLLAQHRVISFLRTQRRNPWTERPDAEVASKIQRVGLGEIDPERRFAERELLGRVLDRLAAELGEHGMELLKMLMLSERPIDEISASSGMSPNAIYTWKSRTAKRAREIARALEAELGEKK